MGERADINLADLQAFITSLRDFNAELEGRWANLMARWNSSSESWRDIKKDQFTGAVGWDEVIKTMENYNSTSEQYTNFLIRLHEKGEDYLNS